MRIITEKMDQTDIMLFGTCFQQHEIIIHNGMAWKSAVKNPDFGGQKMQTINDVPMILRREIEARMITPFLEEFQKELGEEKTREITQKVISRMAEEAGRSMAQLFGSNDLNAVRDKMVPIMEKGGALKLEFPECSSACLRFNTVYCAYAEMFKRIGIDTELGERLCCQRDGYLFRGFNPEIKFTRTKTLMEGGDCCDFCLELTEKGES